MATSISSLSAQLNALAQAGVVSEKATEVIATIPSGTGTIAVSFELAKDYTLQQVHTEILLALCKAAEPAKKVTTEPVASTTPAVPSTTTPEK